MQHEPRTQSNFTTDAAQPDRYTVQRKTGQEGSRDRGMGQSYGIEQNLRFGLVAQHVSQFLPSWAGLLTARFSG